MSHSNLANWNEYGPIDPELEKTINSLLQPSHSDGISPINSFMHAWPGSVTRTLSDPNSNSIFGLSPSISTGISPGIGMYHDGAFGASRLDTNWPASYQCARTNSSESTTEPSPSTSHSVPGVDTPVDVPSLQGDMTKPLGTGRAESSESSITLDDIMELEDFARDDSTPQLSPASLGSQPSPRNANASLFGYHSNVAADHAQHLADLVKTSNIIGAGHSGPRSLASSLSRSVLNADAIARPNPHATQSAQVSGKALSIQQRRRLSQIDPSFSGLVPTQSHQEGSGRRRQHSAPDPIVPPLVSSPEMAKAQSPVVRPRRNTRSSGSDRPSALEASLPSSEDACDDWNDSVLVNSHDLVFVLSLKGTVLYISPSVERILGFLPEEIIGRPLVDFSHPADIGPFSRELKEAITLPQGDEEVDEGSTAVKVNRRVDLIMRMVRKDGGFCLIETTGRVSVDPPKHRKVVVCSGRPQPIPMLPWTDVRQDLMSSEPSAWLKISHNGIFLGSTGPINQILGIEDVNLLGRHIRDLPMVTSSSDLLEALKCGRSISVQDHYDGAAQKAPVKLTVYPWTSNGRSSAVSFVHVQQQPIGAPPVDVSATSSSTVPAKRKVMADDIYASADVQDGSGSLSGAALQANGSTIPVMTANDAASTVFAELTGYHSGSWLIEMQKLHNANKRLRHELSALRKRTPMMAPVATF